MVTQWEMLIRLVLAVVLGSVIGLERERLQWAAGLRTHILVCVGATLFMLVSSFGFTDALTGEHVALDPSRIAAQVVSGIGFLGAGTILFKRDKIRGLTTAASLWSVAAIGLSIGAGLYTAAVGATLIILGVLAGLKPLERRLFKSVHSATEIILVVEHETASLAVIEAELASAGVAIRNALIEDAQEDKHDEITLTVGHIPPEQRISLLARLRQAKGVRSVESRH